MLLSSALVMTSMGTPPKKLILLLISSIQWNETNIFAFIFSENEFLIILLLILILIYILNQMEI